MDDKIRLMTVKDCCADGKFSPATFYRRAKDDPRFPPLYQRARCLTHAGDSQRVEVLNQCLLSKQEALMGRAIDLRDDYDGDDLRRLARRGRDSDQTRRLLALAVIYDGGGRTDAAQIGGVTLQIVRDWVLRFNADGPEGLKNRWGPGPTPKLTAEHRRALAEMVERGPIPAIHGVVRWRRCDLAQELYEMFGVSVEESTVGRTLREMGYRKLSARPRHHAQNEYAVEDFKKPSPPSWRKSRRASTPA